jgi:hypothetical protein
MEIDHEYEVCNEDAKYLVEEYKPSYSKDNNPSGKWVIFSYFKYFNCYTCRLLDYESEYLGSVESPEIRFDYIRVI